jgi:hypothetical protein
MRARRLVVVAVVVVGLGACGSDEPGTGGAGAETTTGDGVSAELAGVIADAQRMAPALERELAGGEYPTSLEGALEALEGAGIAPSEGNVVGGYEFDADAVEFVLCIEGPSGAFASYDTRPMSLFTNGESGGCPQ